jgi:ER lumen protein retaining receptor
VYQVVPSAILAVLINPATTHIWIVRVLFAFTMYLETVSVLPQIRYMQNAKVYTFRILFYYSGFYSFCIEYYDVILTYIFTFQMVETFTGYYVFALGVSRFFSLAYWIIHVRFFNIFYIFLNIITSLIFFISS